MKLQKALKAQSASLDLQDPYRLFVKERDILVAEKEATMFLFNDILILGTKESNDAYQYHSSHVLRKVKRVDFDEVTKLVSKSCPLSSLLPVVSYRLT